MSQYMYLHYKFKYKKLSRKSDSKQDDTADSQHIFANFNIDSRKKRERIWNF